MTGTHSGSVWTVAWCCRRNLVNQPSPCTPSSWCGHCCCCCCFLCVCFRRFPPACLLSPLRLFTPSFVFPSLAEPGARQCCFYDPFLWSQSLRLFSSSSLLTLSERCSGPGCDPERIQRRPRRTLIHPGGEQFPSLVRKDQRWLIKDAVHQFDWIWRMFFVWFYCYFFTLRLYAWLLQRHVFLPGKSQILFAEAGSMTTISASREQQETF